MSTPEWKAKANPWEPPAYDETVIYAVRAVHAGTANAAQQKLFWSWLQYASGADDISFRPGDAGQWATSFAEGKRFIGQQVRKLLHPSLTPPAMNAAAETKPKASRQKKPRSKP
jgi:hypothetical protein